jgi:hypothetical protein
MKRLKAVLLIIVIIVAMLTISAVSADPGDPTIPPPYVITATMTPIIPSVTPRPPPCLCLLNNIYIPIVVR